MESVDNIFSHLFRNISKIGDIVDSLESGDLSELVKKLGSVQSNSQLYQQREDIFNDVDVDAKFNLDINVVDSDGFNKIKQESCDADIDNFLVVENPLHHLKSDIDVHNILLKNSDIDKCFLWHRRLGDLNFKDMKCCLSNKIFLGIDISHQLCNEYHFCSTCASSKSVKLSKLDGYITIRAKKRLQHVYAMEFTVNKDIDGITITSNYLMLLDAYSNKVWMYERNSISDEVYAMQCFVEEFGCPIEISYFTSNDKKSDKNLIMHFCLDYSIKCNLVFDNNGARKLCLSINKKIIEMANNLVLGAKSTMDLYLEAIKCSAYIYNNVFPSRIANNKSCNELWSDVKPDISHFKVLDVMRLFPE
jgi:hypothetical protein